MWRRIPIDLLRLEERTLNALVRNGVYTVEQLEYTGRYRTSLLRGVGARGIGNICRQYKKYRCKELL